MWKNKAVQFLKRVRSPRYAAALVIGAAYFFFAFGGQDMFLGRSHSARIADSMNNMIQYFGPLMLAIVISLWWVWGKSAQPIVLTPPEANLLIPAPWSRRTLVLFKITSAQPALVMSAFMTTLIMRTPVTGWALRIPALYAMFATLFLHQMGASFVHAAVREQGRAAWRRMWLPIIVFSAILFVVAKTIVSCAIAFRMSDELSGMNAAISAIFHQPAQRIAFALPNALVAPAIGGAHVFRALVVIVLVLALHVLWVLGMDTAFEEGAVEAGAKRAAMIEAMREGGITRVAMQQRKKHRKPWFALPSTGEPVVAVWWKNVLFATRNFTPAIVVLLLAVPLILAALDAHDTHDFRKSLRLGAIALLLFGTMWTMFGPLIMRIDLRMDLRRIELMRSLPVGGARLVIAELAAGASVIAAVQLALFGVGLGTLFISGVVQHPMLVSLFIIPGIIFLLASDVILLVILNGFAIMFPAWSKLGTERPGGVEHIGQNILTMVGTVFLFAVALIPALLAGIASGAMSFTTMGKLAGIPVVLIFLATLFLEAVFGAFLLSRFYDELDPVEAGLCS